MERRGRVASQHDALPEAFCVGVRFSESRSPAPAYKGGGGARSPSVARAELDDLAEIHDGDPVRDVLSHRKIVGDEDQGQIHLPHELGQQIQNLGLDRDVEGGDGLVGDDDRWTQRQGRATAIRCLWPPENSCGYFWRSRGANPTRCMSSATWAGTAAGAHTRWTSMGSASAAKTVMRGLRDAYGSGRPSAPAPGRRHFGGAGRVRCAFRERSCLRGGHELKNGPGQRRLAAARFAKSQNLARSTTRLTPSTALTKPAARIRPNPR